MTDLIGDVYEFHAACDLPERATPGFPARVRQKLRAKLIYEEVNELLPAMYAAANLEAIADGIADSIYVLIGAAFEYGIPLEDVWAEVQAANMRKVDPATGKVTYRSDGKVLKPPGWTGPNIALALAA